MNAPTTGLQRESLRALVASADVRLPAGPKLALIAIARCHDDRTRRSTCSLKTIAALSGVSEKQAGRNIETLVALGLIARLPRAGRSSSYVIDLVALAQARNCRPSDALEAVDNSATTPDMGDAYPGHLDAPPRTFEPLTPDTHVPRTEGVLIGTEGGTGTRAGQALDQATLPPFPFSEDLKTQQPRTAVDEVLARIADKRAEQLPIGGSDIRRLIEAADASGEVPLAVAADAVRGCLTAFDAPAAAAPALAVAQALPPEAAVAIAPDTLAAVNAQRVRNGKTAFKRAELHDLHREATLAGIAPQAAAEWILGRPGRNFFRADFASAASLATPAVAPAGPVELTAAGRAAQALRARYESGAGATPPAATPAVVCPVAAASATPAAPTARPPALRTVVRRDAAPVSIGAVTGTGWAQRAVARFVAAEPINHATITSAAVALGLSLADLKAQRAAALAPVAA